MTSTTVAPRSRPANVVAASVLVVDLVVLAYAVLVGVWTGHELNTNPHADPLTAIGYVIALFIGAPAALSLLLLGVGRRCRGRAGDVLLSAALMPPLLLVLYVLVEVVA